MRPLAAAVALLAAGTLVAPAPASGDVRALATCSVTGVTPSSVTVGADPVTVRFGVTGGCTTWELHIPELFLLAADDNPVEVLDPAILHNPDAGRHDVRISYCEGDEVSGDVCDGIATKTFVLRRRTSFGGTFDATPEPARRNTTIRLTGKLLRYDWQLRRYAGYQPPASSRTAYIQFQPVGGTWFDYKPVTIGAGGVTKGAVVANLDGAWRYRFPGNISSGSSFSNPDYVDVR